MLKFCPYCLERISFFATKCPHCLSIQPSFLDYFPFLFWGMIIVSICLLGVYVYTSYIIFLMIMFCTACAAVIFFPFYLYYLYHKNKK